MRGKIIFFASLLSILLMTCLAYSQDVVIPADNEDIEAFDSALVKQSQIKGEKAGFIADQFKKKGPSDENVPDAQKSQYAKTDEDKIEEEISKEAKKIKDLDGKTRDKIKSKAQAKANADAQDLQPKPIQNPADVIRPSDKASGMIIPK